MTTPMETLIKAYQAYAILYTELEPVLSKDAAAAVSFSQYVRNFCLAMIVRVDASNVDHRNFVNNLTLISLPEMDEEEYRHATSAYSTEHYDDYLYSKQEITQKLLAYDKEHHTKLTKSFVSRLTLIAEIFTAQNYNFKQPVDAFISQFQKNADAFIAAGGSVMMNGQSATTADSLMTEEHKAPTKSTPVVPARTNAATQIQPKETYSPGPTVDGQYWLRIIVPMLITIGFVIGAFMTEQWVMLLIAIIPLCFMIAGMKAAKRRCLSCGAWDSMVTIKSRCVGQQRVKVRRNLSSSYYRTSGTHTFGSRQVFVSADEYTYNEVYRCNVCGHEMAGTRKAIDDGIR